jgi:hypothetical protein
MFMSSGPMPENILRKFHPEIDDDHPRRIKEDDSVRPFRRVRHRLSGIAQATYQIWGFCAAGAGRPRIAQIKGKNILLCGKKASLPAPHVSGHSLAGCGEPGAYLGTSTNPNGESS